MKNFKNISLLIVMASFTGIALANQPEVACEQAGVVVNEFTLGILKANCYKAYTAVLEITDGKNREYLMIEAYMRGLYKNVCHEAVLYALAGQEDKAWHVLQGLLVELNRFLVAAATNQPLIDASPLLKAKLAALLPEKI